jgi:phospholipid/cholesterol/gamma-HCH transport system ATP-binding protein
MVGLLKPAKGTVRLFGNEITEQDDPATVDLLKKVGVLFQNGALLGSLTVEDNVALPLQLHTTLPENLSMEIVAFKLTQVDLPGAGKLYPVGTFGRNATTRSACARAGARSAAALLR